MILETILIVLASLVGLIIILTLYLISPKRVNKKIGFSIKHEKFAHRGLYSNSENIPENSMLAFKKAIDQGYGIELDIRETLDNEIVVFHDDSLRRMAGLDCLVNELTLAKLQNLKLLNSEEKIPTLKEVLDLVDGKVPLLIEYKANLPGSECLSLCVNGNTILKEYQGKYCIESFNYMVLNWYKKNRPDILRGQLGMGMQCYEIALGKDEAKKLPMKNRRMVTYLLCNFIGRPHFISYRWQDINIAVKINKFLGAKIACWTVNNINDSLKLLKDYDCVIFEKYLA